MRESFHSILPPRKRRRPWGPILGGVVVLGLIGGAVALLPRLGVPAFWTLRSIELEGNRALAREELLAHLGLSEGMPWWEVRRSRLEERAAREPRVLHAEFDLHFPKSIRVRVEEREGMIRVIDSEGAPSLELSADGVVLDVVPGLSAVDLPWLTGTPSRALKAGDRLDLAGAEGWTDQLARLRGDWPVFWGDISELRYAGERGFEMYLRGGRKVVLWDPTRNEDLWAEVPRVLSDLDRWNVDDAVLNLRYKDQVVVKPASDEMPDFERPDPDAIEGEAPTPKTKPKAKDAHSAHGRKPA